ncbi:MAG: EAL domain-containing protein [Desulfuromonas thiophila]|nr:EAL domain-containing protein [Desulfuromonas thiophila]
MESAKALRILWPLGLILWTGLILLLGYQQRQHHRQAVLDMARAEAIGSYNKDLVYRRWVARQGGVYVRTSAYTPANPFLAHLPDRDITTSTGKSLTLVNPAYMTRQVHELATEQYGNRGHITSRKPLRPENAPDAWERASLEAFTQGVTETLSVAEIDGKPYLRLMRPMITEVPCLKCHASQGYQAGEQRGGISVSIPLRPYQAVQAQLTRLGTLHLAILWLLGLLFFLYFKRVVDARIREVEQARSAVEQSERKYRLLFNEMEIGFGLADATSGEILDCNPCLARLVERSPAELIGQKQSILHPEATTPEGLTEDFVAHRKAPQGSTLNAQLRTKSGQIREVEIQTRRLELDGRQLFLGMFKDVTDLHAHARQSFLLLQAIEQSPIAILITDLQGVPQYINRYFSVQKGYRLADLQRSDNPVHQFLRRHIADFRQNGAASGIVPVDWTEERLARRKNGSTYWERSSFSPVYDQQGQLSHFLMLGEDISDEKNSALQFEYLATHDSLTGLANRLLLHDRTDQAILKAKRQRQQVFLLLLDLDRFKIVNDSLGHDIGDQLLLQVAERLRGAVRESDTVARLGGDEFVVLFPEVNSDTTIVDLAESIRRAIASPIRIQQREIQVTASIGLSQYPAHGDCCAELIRHADLAMYRAKESGNCLCSFDPAMDQRMAETLEIESDLRHALTRDQLLLHYQPKVACATGQLIGMEALLRWRHPEKGLISPALFIPVAEQTGLIGEIGSWVLDTVCRQIADWQRNSLQPVTVAINLSARQFERADLACQIHDQLQARGVAAGLLEVELTEGLIMKNPLAAVQIMEQLKQYGVRIALDDFGTGYSSLNYLRRFPLDVLKIDRSFVDDLGEDRSAEAVATSIVSIAHSLGLQAVAEGVETETQLRFLRQIGCDQVQGYYFHKPLPVEAITELLTRSQQE